MDAKGIFDTLDKITSGSKADRRIAVDLAVIREIMERLGSSIRWVPHPAMTVDVMTKSDVSKGNASQFRMLETGLLRLVAEEDSLKERKEHPSSKNRSRASSSKYLSRTQRNDSSGQGE